MQQQPSAKQRRKEAAAELEQAQAVQLALEATRAASTASSKLASDALSALRNESSGSLNARREGRRRTRRRSRAGGSASNNQAQAAADAMKVGAMAGKERRKKGSVDRREGAGVRGARLGLNMLLEDWEPIQLTLPEIRWRGVQLLGGTSNIGCGRRQPVPRVGEQSWQGFSLNKQAVVATLDAALSQQPV